MDHIMVNNHYQTSHTRGLRTFGLPLYHCTHTSPPSSRLLSYCASVSFIGPHIIYSIFVRTLVECKLMKANDIITSKGCPTHRP